MSNDRGRIVEIDYTNYQGVRGVRKIRPIALHFEANAFHIADLRPQWFLEAFALDRQETRMFAMKDIHSWKVSNG